jgi:hypothetical protein
MKKKPDNYMYMSPEDKALFDYINAGEEFIAEGPAEYEVGSQLEYRKLDPSELARLGNTSLNNVSTDPRYRSAEMDALAQLEEQSNTGMTAREEADLARMKSQTARDNRGRIGAIKQNMAARGMSGSGMDLVAQMQASQDAAERDALVSLETNAQKLDRKTAATMQRGQLAGSMRSRDYSEKARAAEAQDAINRFNTANSVNTQMQNNNNLNAARMTNWQRGNQVSDNNTNARYTYNRDKLGVGQENAQMAYNKATDDYNRAQLRKQQRAKQRAGVGSAIGTVAGGVAGAYFSGGNPYMTAAGAKAGGAAGEGFSNFAHGGRVPGDSPFPGDDEMNDIFSAQLSPGEVVIPRTIASDPSASAQYVDAVNNGLDPMSAKYVAQNDRQKIEELDRKVFYPTPTGAPISSAPMRVKAPTKQSQVPSSIAAEPEMRTPYTPDENLAQKFRVEFPGFCRVCS